MSAKGVATMEPLMTYRKVGKRLGVTERTVWNLVDRGRLEAVRFGHSVRIDPVDPRGFIDSAKHGASPAIREEAVHAE
jgi:excisionase family DNA binding protein